MNLPAVDISIVVPVYNDGAYIEDCILSVLGQRAGGFELIFIDDASPDDAAGIVATWAARDPRIVLERHASRCGQAAARNTGLRRASGRYVFFMYADDFLYDDRVLETLLAIADETGADETLGLILRWLVVENVYELGAHRFAFQYERRRSSLARFPLLGSNVTVCSKLYRREFLETYALTFDEELLRGEDNPFAWAAHSLARRVAVSRRPCYVYRRYPRSDRPSYDEDISRVDYTLLSLEKLCDFFDRNAAAARHRHLVEMRYHNAIRTCCQAIDHADAAPAVREKFLARVTTLFERLPARSKRHAWKPTRRALQALDDGRDELAWRHFLTRWPPPWWQRLGVAALERRVRALPPPSFADAAWFRDAGARGV